MSDESGPAPGDRRTDEPTPEEIAWMVVRSRLAADSRGQELLITLAADPDKGAEELRRYLFSERGADAFTTVVSGGSVGRLVNIARAEVVNIGVARQEQGPRQLPGDIDDFVDRVQVISAIETAARATAAGQGVPRLFAIVGGGGIGKTTLAVHVSHRLAGDFPDAQLYVNLRGAQTRPLDPHDVLETFLRALGMEPDRIAASTEGRQGQYRALLSTGRRVVVLDDAAGERQVRPLVPSGSDNLVLVTSRSPLIGLEGATRVSLDLFSSQDAVDLLTRILGAQRSQGEPEAALELGKWCGNLPLALRIVGARLAAKPHWRLSRMVTRLHDESRRLSEMEAGDLAVRSSFAMSYEALDARLRAAFRHAALIPAQTFPAWPIAALLDLDAGDGEELAEQLTELHLLRAAGEDEAGQMRYQFHDLVRLFARERLEAEERAEGRLAAVERMLGGYLALSQRALHLLSPHSKRDAERIGARLWPLPAAETETLLSDPYAWFTAEHAALVGAVEQAHALGAWAHCYLMAEQAHYYFRVRSHLRDWERTHRLALHAARSAGDRTAEGWTLRNLGNALQDQGRYAEAVECFQTSAAVFADAGNPLGRAAALCNLGETYLTQGRFAQAMEYLDLCLPGWAASGDRVGVAYTLDNLGFVHLRRGDFAQAESYLARGLAAFRELGDRFGEAHSLCRRAELHSERGSPEAAADDLRRSSQIFAAMASPTGQAWSMLGLSRVLRRQDRAAEALAEATRSVRVFQDHGDVRAGALAMIEVGLALRHLGRGREARAVLEQSAERLRSIGDEFGAALAVYRLGQAEATDADPRAAGHLEIAAAAFDRLASAHWRRRALDDLARARR